MQTSSDSSTVKPILCDDIVVTSLVYPKKMDYKELISLVAAEILMTVLKYVPAVEFPLRDLQRQYLQTTTELSKASVEHLLLAIDAKLGSQTVTAALDFLQGKLKTQLGEYDLVNLYTECLAMATECAFGEFGKPPEYYGGQPLTQKDLDDCLDRLSSYVSKLMVTAYYAHIDAYCKEGSLELQPDKTHIITRLITSEFLFYTARPLTLAEFNALIQQIATEAATMPQNLHFVLASFAVLSDSGGVMNVTPYIECGVKPKIHCIVKSNASTIDPQYKSLEPDGYLVYPHQVKRETTLALPDAIFLTTGGHCSFSFENVFTCQIADGRTLPIAVDVCIDQTVNVTVARKGFNDWIDRRTVDLILGDPRPLPRELLYTVVSNRLETIDEAGCAAIPTVADPDLSHTQCREGVSQTQGAITDPGFGTPVDIIRLYTSPVPTVKEPEISRIDWYNRIADIITSLTAHEACEYARGQGFDPQTKLLGGTTILAEAIQNQQEAYIYEIANVSLLDLRFCPVLTMPGTSQCIFQKDSLPAVTVIDLHRHPDISQDLVEQLVLSAPNLKHIDLQDCKNLSADYVASLNERLSQKIASSPPTHKSSYSPKLFQEAPVGDTKPGPSPAPQVKK